MRKLAISTAVGPSLGEAAKEIEAEANWETFRLAVPANLKMIEGMLYLAPNNQDLQAQALKANSAYAFGVLETMWLQGQITGNPQAEKANRELALQYYAKGIYWGLNYLTENGISYSQLQRAHRDGTLGKLLGDRLDDPQSIEVVFFLAQSMGASGNLQKTSPMVVAQLPLVKGLFDWVCSIRPNIRYGSCGLFYGAWEVGRPKMLGGNMAKGQQYFLQAMKQYPENYLIRIAYLRFYVIPARDRKIYQQQKAFLNKAFKKWRERFLWPPIKSQHYRDDRNLYNAIALKQFEIIVNSENRLF